MSGGGLTVEVNRYELRAFTSMLEQQVPFATSLAINRTANEAQLEVQLGLEGRFLLRRPEFVKRTIKIFPQERARKDNLRTVIRVDPTRNLLGKFEAGGIKTPTNSSRLAVPSEGVRRKRADVVPGYLRPKALKLQLHRTKSGKVQFKGERRTFLVEVATFNAGILQRVGRGRSSRVVVFYWFQRGVQIDPLLRMGDTVRRVSIEKFEEHFGDALRQAIATAR